ncbi:MAG: hypothetical protein K6E54_01025 [Bacteroidaceae bacterium]|nr:hypothetical protein [Bacteroidaceae bacterium]
MNRQNDIQEIGQLLGRFMSGESSLEEERALAEYFRTHEVSEEWQEYKEMFALFDSGEVDIELENNTSEQLNGIDDGKIRMLPKAVREKPKIIALRWGFVGVAASIALLISFTFFINDEEPAKTIVVAQQTTTQRDSISLQKKKSDMLPSIQYTMPMLAEVVKPKTVEQTAASPKQISEDKPSVPRNDEKQYMYKEEAVEAKLIYASHEITEDSVYKAPARVDEFIRNLAAYNHIKGEELDCSSNSNDSTIMNTAYVFPDNCKIRLFDRMLQVACWYDYKSPGYQLSISQQQLLFCLEDHRLGMKYLWLAERIIGGRIILFATHSPIDVSVSLACFQDFKEKITHTNKTFEL